MHLQFLSMMSMMTCGRARVTSRLQRRTTTTLICSQPMMVNLIWILFVQACLLFIWSYLDSKFPVFLQSFNLSIFHPCCCCPASHTFTSSGTSHHFWSRPCIWFFYFHALLFSISLYHCCRRAIFHLKALTARKLKLIQELNISMHLTCQVLGHL